MYRPEGPARCAPPHRNFSSPDTSVAARWPSPPRAKLAPSAGRAPRLPGLIFIGSTLGEAPFEQAAATNRAPRSTCGLPRAPSATAGSLVRTSVRREALATAFSAATMLLALRDPCDRGSVPGLAGGVYSLLALSFSVFLARAPFRATATSTPSAAAVLAKARRSSCSNAVDSLARGAVRGLRARPGPELRRTTHRRAPPAGHARAIQARWPSRIARKTSIWSLQAPARAPLSSAEALREAVSGPSDAPPLPAGSAGPRAARHAIEAGSVHLRFARTHLCRRRGAWRIGPRSACLHARGHAAHRSAVARVS